KHIYNKKFTAPHRISQASHKNNDKLIPDTEEDPLLASITEKRNSHPESTTSFLRLPKDTTINVHRLPLQCV
ncbi:hypothetical protein NPIL_529761, partial [Nephila pilipes]